MVKTSMHLPLTLFPHNPSPSCVQRVKPSWMACGPWTDHGLDSKVFQVLVMIATRYGECFGVIYFEQVCQEAVTGSTE
jgi:hypothetical protein